MEIATEVYWEVVYKKMELDFENSDLGRYWSKFTKKGDF